jgi:uncharacterized protein (DUF779 family)
MKLTQIAGGCIDGTCPTIYASDRGTLVVQGALVNDSDVVLGEGEALVEIPAELLRGLNQS